MRAKRNNHKMPCLVLLLEEVLAEIVTMLISGTSTLMRIPLMTIMQTTERVYISYYFPLWFCSLWRDNRLPSEHCICFLFAFLFYQLVTCARASGWVKPASDHVVTFHSNAPLAPLPAPLGARASHNTGTDQVGTRGGAIKRRKPQRRGEPFTRLRRSIYEATGSRVYLVWPF